MARKIASTNQKETNFTHVNESKNQKFIKKKKTNQNKLSPISQIKDTFFWCKKNIKKLQRHRICERVRGFTETRRRSWDSFTFGDEQESKISISISISDVKCDKTAKCRERERERNK